MTTFNKLYPTKPAGAQRMCTISDVHLGHRNTPTWAIIDRLCYYVVNPSFFSQLDALFITGDLFDRLLNLKSDGVSEINEFISRLLRLAKQYNVAIRILEGTPSHDWKQSALIPEQNVNAEIGADLQFVDELSIVEDTTLGLTIGYVPDEWRESHIQTTSEFKSLLATRGYAQVDIILMHGMFTFQVPAHVKIPAFDPDEWIQMARYAIYIGHDHKYKTYGIITVPSSFDRLAHNEEVAKGFLISDILNGQIQTYFVENTKAQQYVTLRLVGVEVEEAIDLIERAIAEMGDGRLKLILPSDTTLRTHVINRRKETVVDITMEFENVAAEELMAPDGFDLKTDTVNITADNIAGMIARELDHYEDIDWDVMNHEIAYIQAQC